MKTRCENKIIVIGAGLGGLYVAQNMGACGFDVTVLEKRERNALGYFWHDAVKYNTFSSKRIDLPQDFAINKQVLSFVGPSGEGVIKQSPKASRNLDIDRKKLIEFLLDQAEYVADLRFGVNVEHLLFDGDKVVGVRADGKDMPADLVIDNSGLFGKYRFELPSKYLMGDMLDGGDYLAAFRAFFKKTSDAPTASNVYLMPEGYSVLWCKDAPNKEYADVLVTDFCSLSNEKILKAIEYLKERNPLLTDECVKYVLDYIPVRYPLATVAADGYVLLGNSAFMTKPTNGSGIEYSLKAGQILADVLCHAQDFSVKSLWRYAARVNSSFGANAYMAYVARHNFQNLDRDDLVWLFNSGILNESMLAIARGDIKSAEDFKLDGISKSLHLVGKRRKFMGQIGDILIACANARMLAMRMPRFYNEEAILKWKEEYDANANKLVLGDKKK